MVSICFYFQVHQPYRIRKYNVFNIGNEHNYFDEEKNGEICRKVAHKCYLPTNKVILDLINNTQGKFRVAYSISGVALDQFEKYSPEVIDSFKALAKTGHVEFIDETYYHSLSYLYDKEEFKEQVALHKKRIESLFGVTPTTFRNTELIYNNELAKFIEDLGYDTIIAEGADHILDWRSPNFVYTPHTCKRIKLLLKNYKLSDDIAFRFSNKGWNEWPLTSEKFEKWVSSVNGNGEVVNLFMDYETFGEHQWEDTGIFNFLKQMPWEILKHPDNNFLLPREVSKKYESKSEIDIHHFISWADIERDLSAWLGNKMQQSSMHEVYMIGKSIKKTNDKHLIEDWRKLTTSDHFYYMCTKWFSDGDVHKYFNPYDSPYDSYINFVNVLNDLIIRLKLIESHNKIGNNHENKQEKDFKRTFDISEHPSLMLENKV